MRRRREHYRGCLLGGAIGDALGASIEFLRLVEIRRRFGKDGLTDFAESYGRVGAITDDTQMTLFTAEALLRSGGDGRRVEAAALAEAGHGAYLRWLHTQGYPVPAGVLDRGLVDEQGLHHRRAPGSSCLSALLSGARGTVEAPINDSKGCGAVMRMAPVGLARFDDPLEAGRILGALTHGHPTGHTAAGFFAELVFQLAEGHELPIAARLGLRRLGGEVGARETVEHVEAALVLAGKGPGTAEDVERLGQGWVAEEALAIGLYCALQARDFASGVLLAVNHGGDSDSTGSIAGNILGLVHGEAGLPPSWLERLELRDVITGVADALADRFGG